MSSASTPLYLIVRYPFSLHNSTKHSYTRKFEKLFGRPRDPKVDFFTKETGYATYFGSRPNNYDELCEYNQHYADIAASIQRVTEELIINLANEVFRETGSKRLCLAGGVALNSVANARIWAETPFEELYIQPSAEDGGGALGRDGSSIQPGRDSNSARYRRIFRGAVRPLTDDGPYR